MKNDLITADGMEQVSQGGQFGGAPVGDPAQMAVPTGVPVGPKPYETPEEPASEEEQAAYIDLFDRAMAAIHDGRKDQDDKPSMADNIMTALANKAAPLYKNIGMTVGNLLFLLTTNARRQGVEYPEAAVVEVGKDLVVELMDMAQEVGVVDDLPSGGEDEFTDDEEQTVLMASLEAAKYYGEQMKNSGMITPEVQKAHRGDMEEEMQREADAGELDDWEGPPVSPDNVKVAQQMGVKK